MDLPLIIENDMNNLRQEIGKELLKYEKRYSVASLTQMTNAILALFTKHIKRNKPISSYTDAQVELDRYEKNLLEDL